MSTVDAEVLSTGTDNLRPVERTGRRASRYGGRWVPYLFLLPYLALFVTFVLAPIVIGLWVSLHVWDFTIPRKPWNGLGNYKDLFDSESVVGPDFIRSMKATGIFTLFSVPLLVVVPLAVALLMNAKFKGRNLFRAVYFAPYVLGVAVIAVLWRYILDNNIGLLNRYLGAIGLPDDIAWTTSTPAAWFALIGVTVWWTLGFNAVIYLAGLQDIPPELYEAARVDGAGGWTLFRRITLPLLSPTTIFLLIFTVIGTFKALNHIWVMTQGGPGNATTTASILIFQQLYQANRYGYSAAISFLLFSVILGLSLLQNHFAGGGVA
jgi:multiple sugar transport system permease protein